MRNDEILGIISDFEGVGINKDPKEEIEDFIWNNWDLSLSEFAKKVADKFKGCQFVEVKYIDFDSTFYNIIWKEIVFNKNTTFSNIKKNDENRTFEVITMEKWIKEY